jgi:hypothetical protein
MHHGLWNNVMLNHKTTKDSIILLSNYDLNAMFFYMSFYGLGIH